MSRLFPGMQLPGFFACRRGISCSCVPILTRAHHEYRPNPKKDVSGQSIYDSCIVSYGTNIRSSHGIKGFPLFLSGGGIKNLRLGESIILPKDTPLANVWLTLLQQAGIKIDRFSHSTGSLNEILS